MRFIAFATATSQATVRSGPAQPSWIEPPSHASSVSDRPSATVTIAAAS